MNKTLIFAAIALLIGGFIVTQKMMNQDQELNVDANENEPTNIEDIPDQIMSTINNFIIGVNEETLQNQNVQAFLQLIRTGEGTLGDRGYSTMFGGSLFVGFADHPRKAISRSGLTSTAAGAYQFLSKTWDEMAAKYDLTDFSPVNQDIACLGLIKRAGALSDVVDGLFQKAIAKCNKTWASLPGSPYGQPTLNMAKAEQILINNGAQFA